MKRLLFLSLLAIFCLVPVLNGQAVDKAQVSSVRIATRNDANTPFVRTVLDVNSGLIKTVNTLPSPCPILK